MTTSIFFTNEQDLESHLTPEVEELRIIEDSLIERAYSGRSLYKLVTVETRLLILLL